MRSITVFAGLALAAAFWVPRHASQFGVTAQPVSLSAHPLTPVACRRGALTVCHRAARFTRSI